MTQIPIYRAKKINSDGWIEGYLLKLDTANSIHIETFEYFIYDELGFRDKIDPSTLAIHFENMIDKNGKKIFASLNENGIGGDNLDYHNLFKDVLFFKDSKLIFLGSNMYFHEGIYDTKEYEVIEIHKG